MRRLNASLIGIDQGDEEVFSEFADGGEMWTGSGARERRKHVRFSEPFKAPPTVQVTLSLWDVDQSANLRADLKARNVTETGFDMVFGTWSDSRVARVRMAWTAIGELDCDEEWALY